MAPYIQDSRTLNSIKWNLKESFTESFSQHSLGCARTYFWTHTYTRARAHLHTHTHTHTHTQASLLYYLIWACNHVCTVWKKSAFACLMLEIGKQVVIPTDRLGFGPWKEKIHNIMTNQERKCYYIDMHNHMCGEVTHFKLDVSLTVHRP